MAYFNKGKIELTRDEKNTFKECQQYFTNPKIRQDFKERLNKFLYLE